MEERAEKERGSTLDAEGPWPRRVLRDKEKPGACLAFARLSAESLLVNNQL